MSLHDFQEKYKQLSIRERVLTLATVIGLMIFTCVNFIFTPMYDHLVLLKKADKSTSQIITTLKSQIADLDKKIASDPEAAIEDEFNKVFLQHKNKIAQLDEFKVALVSSEDMASLVAEVVQENKQLSVLSLVSKKPTVILKDTNGEPLLYKHAIEIKLKGQYFGLLAFMKKIEEKDHAISWSEIDYKVEKYPNAIMTFEIYTVSTDEEFIGVK